MSKLFWIDTDTGVDDAAAIAWLLRNSMAHVLGFTTVFGNSSVTNATANLLTLLDAAAVRLPITIGAAEPLAGSAPRGGELVHGLDGFWGAQGRYNLANLPDDAAGALLEAARANPGLTILALGPLTNLALAAEREPQAMHTARIVAIGGAWRGGNTTPVAEFNIFCDPLALERLLAAGMRVELVTLDAFDRVVVEPEPFLAALGERGGRVGALLACVLGPYFQALTALDAGPMSLPDVAAPIYALHPELGRPVSAVVRVITQPGYAFGQTIIGANPSDRVRLTLSVSEINELFDTAWASGRNYGQLIHEALARTHDNALVIADVDGERMAELLLTGLCVAR
jgi:inosine-uridine nucleoside N-ribohydrolase